MTRRPRATPWWRVSPMSPTTWIRSCDDAVVAANLDGIACGPRAGVPVRDSAGGRDRAAWPAYGLRDGRRAGRPAVRGGGGAHRCAGASDPAIWLLARAQPALARHAVGATHHIDRAGQADRRLGLLRGRAPSVHRQHQ